MPSDTTGRGLVAEARALAGLLPADDGRISDEVIRRTRTALPALADEIETLRTQLDRIREALAQHPRCDVHPDDDEPITCGWMRAVASVQWALDQATQTTTEEDGDE
ncbi:hypothetical protein [Nocardia rhizosphaerae]|uniref:Uncharacterized protein n=1 Tax=Nocardia rhizosphaerae TaxID=1691571 RepID=A0ABV8L2L5_9NOCA